jgi:hypothetical protein
VAIGEESCTRMAELAGLSVAETLGAMPSLHRERLVGKVIELHPHPPSQYALSRLRWFVLPAGRERADWRDVPELLDAEVATEAMIRKRSELRVRVA